jgi:hypothetical protein
MLGQAKHSANTWVGEVLLFLTAKRPTNPWIGEILLCLIDNIQG